MFRKFFICSLIVAVVGLFGMLGAQARGQALLPPLKDPKPGVSYHIEALVSGWSLHVQGFAVKDNADICQGPLDSKQLWQLVPSDEHKGYFQIRTQIAATKGNDSFRYLMVFKRNKDVGGRLCLGKQDPDQVWRLVPAEQAGYFHIESRVSELTLDVADGAHAPGVRVGQAVSHPSQVWGFVPDRGEKKLLIVGTKDFQAALEPFVAHKKKLLPTETVLLESILRETKGADDAEKLKRYLYERWQADNVGYVLLVGDAGIVPVRYTAVNNLGADNGGWSFMPSDLYYANLARLDGSFDNWNARKDGIHADYYGELMGHDGKEPINVDQISYQPEIAVGRWPIHTQDHLKTLVAKTIKYENHVLADDLPAMHQLAFVNGPDLADIRDAMNDWAQKLEKVTRTRPIRLLYKDDGRDDHTPPPNVEEVEKMLTKGAGIVFHCGHGSDTCWDGCLDLQGLKSIQNSNMPPVLFSTGCATATFTPMVPAMPYTDAGGKNHRGVDQGEQFKSPAPSPSNYQRGKYEQNSLGVESIRSGPNGAVAYIGCAVGSQSCSWPLMEGFVDFMCDHDNEPRLGDAWVSALTHYYHVQGLETIKAKDWWNGAIFDQGMTFHLFGDPSMRLPGKPKK